MNSVCSTVHAITHACDGGRNGVKDGWRRRLRPEPAELALSTDAATCCRASTASPSASTRTSSRCSLRSGCPGTAGCADETRAGCITLAQRSTRVNLVLCGHVALRNFPRRRKALLLRPCARATAVRGGRRGPLGRAEPLRCCQRRRRSAVTQARSCALVVLPRAIETRASARDQVRNARTRSQKSSVFASS